jgi:hypothetical protein
MSDDDDDSQITSGGKKKSNGHKANCKCPICKNMKMKKGGSMQQELRPANFVGGKKANGHKSTCKCPICVNMKHQKASKKNRRVTRNRTMKGGVKRDRHGKIMTMMMIMRIISCLRITFRYNLMLLLIMLKIMRMMKWRIWMMRRI